MHTSLAVVLHPFLHTHAGQSKYSQLGEYGSTGTPLRQLVVPFHTILYTRWFSLCAVGPGKQARTVLPHRHTKWRVAGEEASEQGQGAIEEGQGPEGEKSAPGRGKGEGTRGKGEWARCKGEGARGKRKGERGKGRDCYLEACEGVSAAMLTDSLLGLCTTASCRSWRDPTRSPGMTNPSSSLSMS